MEKLGLWPELLDYARWAPSPHNVQPWKLRLISATDAQLFYDPKRLLPDEDPTGRFLMSGFGIFLETLDIAASAKGFAVNPELLAKSFDIHGEMPILLANLTIVPSATKDILDRELIKARRTSRLAYEPKQVDTTVIAEIAAIAKSFGHELESTSDPATVEWVLKLNRDTMFYDMNDDLARNEVGHWVRYSAQEAAMKKDGLWSKCMNTASSVMYLFFHARWVINLPGIYQVIGKIYLGTTDAKTVAWLQGPFRTTDEWINAGRMLMRIWLTLTKHGVYLHPFGSVITNQKAHQRFQEKFNLDERADVAWLLMRIGYSKEPPRSKRLTVEEILL